MPRSASAAMYSGCSFVVKIALDRLGHQQRGPHVGVVAATRRSRRASPTRRPRRGPCVGPGTDDARAPRRSTGSPAFHCASSSLCRLVQHDVREQRALREPARSARTISTARSISSPVSMSSGCMMSPDPSRRLCVSASIDDADELGETAVGRPAAARVRRRPVPHHAFGRVRVGQLALVQSSASILRSTASVMSM